MITYFTDSHIDFNNFYEAVSVETAHSISREK